MTFDERVQVVTTFGFTERQSAFLVTVMLHAGVCLGRHYCTFAGLAYGRKMHDFFERVVTGRYGTAQTCRHNTARIYHIHNKRLHAPYAKGNFQFERVIRGWRGRRVLDCRRK